MENRPHLPDLCLNICRVVVLGVAPDEMNGVVIEMLLGVSRLKIVLELVPKYLTIHLFLVPLGPLVPRSRTVQLGSLVLRHPGKLSIAL